MDNWLHIFTKFQKQVRATSVPFYNWVCFLKSDIWSLYSEWITQGIEFQKTRWPLGLKKKKYPPSSGSEKSKSNRDNRILQSAKTIWQLVISHQSSVQNVKPVCELKSAFYVFLQEINVNWRKMLIFPQYSKLKVPTICLST